MIKIKINIRPAERVQGDRNKQVSEGDLKEILSKRQKGDAVQLLGGRFMVRHAVDNPSDEKILASGEEPDENAGEWTDYGPVWSMDNAAAVIDAHFAAGGITKQQRVVMAVEGMGVIVEALESMIESAEKMPLPAGMPPAIKEIVTNAGKKMGIPPSIMLMIAEAVRPGCNCGMCLARRIFPKSRENDPLDAIKLSAFALLCGTKGPQPGPLCEESINEPDAADVFRHFDVQ